MRLHNHLWPTQHAHLVHCFWPRGACANTVTMDRLRQLKIQWAKAPISHTRTFEEDIVALVSRHSGGYCDIQGMTKQEVRRHLSKATHTTHTLQPAIAKALTSTFGITTHWLTSPLHHHAYIPRFASAHDHDVRFAALHDNWAHIWQGAGLAVPPHDDVTLHKALTWAIASAAYLMKPTLNVLVVPCRAAQHGISNLLKHPAVHRFCKIQAGTMRMQHSLAWTGRAPTDSKIKQDMLVLVIANNLGVQAYFRPGLAWHLEQTLRAARGRTPLRCKPAHQLTRPGLD